MDARIQDLPFDPAALHGLSEKLLRSHHQNNCGGAVKRPAKAFKGKRPHVLGLNDVAWKIVALCRGVDEKFVFVLRRERVKNVDDAPAMPFRPVHTLNNTSFQTAGGRRASVGFLCMICATLSASACMTPGCLRKTGPCCWDTP